jgi:hypothetical protein
MEDDLVSSLTYQVKEEVIENYVLERRLIELQIEHLQEQAAKTNLQAQITGKRLNRLGLLMIRPEMLDLLVESLHLSSGCFWEACLEEKLSCKRVRLIRVRALTQKSKFRKLVIESYSRLYDRMKQYRKHYDDLSLECAAVNRNIETFGKNFDLLAILNFLRNLDMRGLERKKILGENFTAKEVATLDRNLYIRPISLEKFGVPSPLDIPETRQIEDKLSKISDEIYRKYGDEVRKILK